VGPVDADGEVGASGEEDEEASVAAATLELDPIDAEPND